MNSPTPISDYRTLPGPSRPRVPTRTISRFTDASQPQQPTFQPRIVRGTVTSLGAPSSQYSNGTGSTRSPRTRRASTAAGNSSSSTSLTNLSLGFPYGANGSVGAPAMHQRKLSLPAPSSLSSDPARPPYGAYDSPISFPLPAYLEHSAFRRFIQITPYIPFPLHSNTYSHHPELSDRHRDRQHQLRANPRLSNSSALRRSFLHDSDDDSSSDGERRSPSYRGGIPHGPRPSTAGASSLAAAAISHEAFDDEMIQLPTRWNREDRSPSLNISADGREVHFNGLPVPAEKEAAAVRANFPMPRLCGIYYYEVEIINKGLKGHIGIGFGTSRVSLTRLPGWAQPGWQPEWAHESWGYHGDDGRSFASQDTGSPYGQKFSTGDTIGCGVDFTLKRAFYTKNGAFQGYVFEDVDGELYPMVGLRTQGETIKANFGHAPFKFDIESHVHQRRNATWAKIQSTPITWAPSSRSFGILRERDTSMTNSSTSGPPSALAIASINDVSNVMDQIVLDYLHHHGYAGAGKALRKAMESKSALGLSSVGLPTGSGSTSASSTSTEESDTISRQHIMSAIVSGDIDFALSETRSKYPAAIDAKGGWMLFRLRCRKFVELVLEAAAALKIARKIEAAGASSVQRTIGAPSAYPSFETGMHPDSLVHGTVSEEQEDVDVDVDADADAMEVDEVAQALVGTAYSSPVHHSAFPVSVEFSTPIPGKSPQFQSQKQWEKRPAQGQTHTSSAPTPSPTTAQIALEHAFQYGRLLNADYEHDERPHVQYLFRRTFSLVAYESPLEVGGDVSRLAGQGAREELATELNEAILASQGKHPCPMLERVVAHTTSVVLELGFRGSGIAAFADTEKEFLHC